MQCGDGMTAMRCLLLLGALRAATALAPEAVEALLSIGDGERLSYLDFRESLHNEWSRNVSAPAVAAVRTACGGSFCAPETNEYGRYAVVDHAPADRLATDPEARAAAARFQERRTGLSHAFVLAHYRSYPHVAREAVLSRLRFYGDAWTCVVDQGAAERADDTSARDFVRTLRALIKRPDRLLLANGTTTHELSAYANGVRAIVAAAGSFPDLWLFSHATTLVVRPFPDRLPPCGVTRLGPSPFPWQPRCRADASNANDAVASSMAARLGLDTCRHHHDAQPVLGFADATIIATGDAVATTLLKGFDAYAAAVAETIKTLDGRYVSKKHHTLLPRGENYLHGLSDHVSGLLVAASQCAAAEPLFPEAHGASNPFVSKINGVPCGWGQCALDAALRLIAEADRNPIDGLLTRSELAAYDGSVPASCDVGRDWSASAKARGGDWDGQAKRKTGLARLCYQVLCDRDRSIALGQAYTAQGTAKRARKLIARGGSL